jgi:hypothetical protein
MSRKVYLLRPKMGNDTSDEVEIEKKARRES